MKDDSAIPEFIIPSYGPNILILRFGEEGPQKKGSYVFTISGSITQLDFT